MKTNSTAYQFFSVAAALLAGIILWAVLQANSMLTGTVEEQFQWIRQHALLFKLNYFVGSCLTVPSFLLLGLMVAQRRVKNKLRLADILALVFLILYVVFIQLAYSTQYILIPQLIESMDTNRNQLLEALYIGNQASFTAYLRLMGYTFMSVSAVIIGWPFGQVYGYSRWSGLFLFLSGIAGIWGWLEYVVNLPTQGMGVTISGLFMIPFCLAVLLTTYRQKSGRHQTALST